MTETTTTEVRRPRRHLLRWFLLALVVVLVLVVATGWILQSKLTGQVEHVPDAMPPAGVERPEPGPAEAMNLLLLGSDKRADGSVAGQRSDTMMVVNIAADRESMSLVSIPRDSWVDVPGHGKAKINAAFSWGGPALAVQTVEQLTDVRIDHVAVIDWEGFKRLTDALGGVEITIAEDSYDTYRDHQWKAGTYRMDGEEALLYVRQRAGLVGGDFDRVKRQQNFLRALMSETLSAGTLANPVRTYRVLDAVTSNLAVDEDFTGGSMRSLALSLRGIRSGDVRFTTIPVTGTGMEGAQSVVYVDHDTAAGLWKAFREDEAAAWIDANEADLPDSVN